MPNKYLDSVGLAEYTSLVKTALSGKADISSPALTGTPTAPTPTAGDDSTKIATTEFVQDEVANYLPLTGGSVTGNLTVSGTITGNVTGNVTGTASGNLPLSGGTMTGEINYGEKAAQFSKYNNSSTINIVGSSTDSGIGILSKRGSFYNTFLILSSGDQSTNPRFRLLAGDGTTSKELVGKPDGTLTWGGKNVERVNASGTNYIRYESGLQICWGNCATSTSGASANTFPVAFSAAPKVVAQEKPGTINHALYMVKLSNVTTTGFQSVVTDGTNYQQWVAEYIAVGRWK